ncbi:helix-turn-helix domain-containing protein [Lachnobacterium bovis]|uniref:helix-turn-helix domain-containing protein n=1 Tax=Lachnobacterium bovis TaxID=140626 RepID=UPI003B508087
MLFCLSITLTLPIFIASLLNFIISLSVSAKYNADFKKEVVDAYIKSAKSYSEITAEFNMSKTSVRDLTKKYSEECQYTNLI